jgi:hypothetical protein
MEPTRVTPPHLLAIQAQLIAREPIFHRPEFGTTRDDFERMTDESFWEVGASGRRYSREFAIRTLLARQTSPQDDVWETHDFFCQTLAPSLYLLTYTLMQGERITRRSTIWRDTAEGWVIVFHQGTLVQTP